MTGAPKRQKKANKEEKQESRSGDCASTETKTLPACLEHLQ
jgi:hypothetical protein